MACLQFRHSAELHGDERRDRLTPHGFIWAAANATVLLRRPRQRRPSIAFRLQTTLIGMEGGSRSRRTVTKKSQQPRENDTAHWRSGSFRVPVDKCLQNWACSGRAGVLSTENIKRM